MTRIYDQTKKGPPTEETTVTIKEAPMTVLITGRPPTQVGTVLHHH